MYISENQIKAILDTLPIGLYCGRRIDVTLDEKAKTSYYKPKDDSIHICPTIIQKGLEHAVIDETYSVETAIRSMLYHEISHAIMTPIGLARYRAQNEMTILNIFEDERIETLLRDFYYDTNFKKHLLYTNGGEVPTATNNLQKFFNLVRFRLYQDTPFADRVTDIINNYASLNVANPGNSTTYVNEVVKLYKDFCSSCNDDTTSESEGEKEEREEEIRGTSGSSGSALENNDKKYTPNNEEGENSEKGESAGEGTESEESEGKPSADSEKNCKSSSSKSMKDILQDSRALSRENVKELAQKVFTSPLNEEVYTSLNTIISQFNKKNKGGNGLTGYSGILNPRNCTREDYRFFERACSINGNNRFGTLHLNLFLDDSGSFSSNDEVTNEILRALAKIESINKNFTFDVYFVAEGIRKADKDKRLIESHTGNWLVHEIFDIFRKAQLPNSYNYNIVLFDGDAFSQDVGAEIPIREGDENNFRAFDSINTTIISDPFNKKYIKDNVHSAKVIYTRDYVNELSTHIINALTQGFR